MTTAYEPSKQYEIKVWDVEFRRDPARTLMARLYQPQGDGLTVPRLPPSAGSCIRSPRASQRGSAAVPLSLF